MKYILTNYNGSIKKNLFTLKSIISMINGKEDWEFIQILSFAGFGYIAGSYSCFRPLIPIIENGVLHTEVPFLK